MEIQCFLGIAKMKLTQRLAVIFAFFVLTFSLSGCGDKFFDPTQVGRFRPVPAVNIILDTLGVAEETPSQWKEAEEPKPIDIMVMDTDYIFGAGDTVRVDIYELIEAGRRYVNDFRISETGKISIPMVGTVEATGLTETELEEDIKRILSPSILKEPLISVTMMRSQHRVYTILGQAVSKSGRYGIPRVSRWTGRR